MIYFDNSATTKPYKEVVDLIADLSLNIFGNPSSLHTLGLQAEKILEKSRKMLAETIKATPDELIFTSGGTEAINMALKGSADANKRSGRHILSTPIEHSASLESLKVLQEMGFEVELINVDAYGKIDLADLKNKLKSDTILVNIMLVNNEIGTIQPVGEAAAIIKSFKKEIVFHIDAIQGFGKMPISTKLIKADLISFSSHKVHGPKGVGLLYVRHGTKINAILSGGGQEKHLRPGTVNVPGIAGFAHAAVKIVANMEEDNRMINRVRSKLIEGLSERIPEKIRVNSPTDALPGILNISFDSFRAEVILHALEQKEIYVSSGSACNSKKQSVSHVIKAMNLPANWSEGAIRFSFSGENTEEEAHLCAEALSEIIHTFGQISRLK